MDSSFEGVMLDLGKCSKLSIDEKRRLVYDMAKVKQPHCAAEMLQSWSRQELLQMVCVEMGKVRKYTGLNKLKLIELLLKIVSAKKTGDRDPGGILGQLHSPMAEHKASMRQRKADHPYKMPVSVSGSGSGSSGNLTMSYGDGGKLTGIYCKNSACKATLSRVDEFCKRCSCCLCRKFDDNKDPSLWLTCCSEPPFQGRACNMSFHLECFLKRGASSIAKAVQGAEFDGTFYCVSCGKVNDFLSCWRKQLMIAKETRRVDILCYRLSLCQRLLAGTTIYRKVSEIVGEAVKKLEADVGPLTGLSMNMGRGIVNRLSAGPQVQKLCGSAVETLESMMYHTSLRQLPDPLLQGCKLTSPNMIRFEDVSATCVTVVLGSNNPPLGNNSVGVGYTLWHHKANDEKGTDEPTCTLFPPETRFVISGLAPATEYAFKVVSFDCAEELSSCEVRLTTSGSSRGDIVLLDAKGSLETERIQSPMTTNCSTLSNPSSVEEEKTDGQSAVAEESTHGDTGLPVTPCRIDTLEGGKRGESPAVRVRSQSTAVKKELEDGFEQGDKVEVRILPKKRSVESGDDDAECGGGNDDDDDDDDDSDEDFEKYVKVIRWLEQESHFEKSFRQKFLTWYTMRATPQEERVVKVFIDTLSDDLASLAEQLVDTFGEVVSSKKSSAVVPTGLCMKLWH